MKALPLSLWCRKAFNTEPDGVQFTSDRKTVFVPSL